jgi:hypothetical protein
MLYHDGGIEEAEEDIFCALGLSVQRERVIFQARFCRMVVRGRLS